MTETTDQEQLRHIAHLFKNSFLGNMPGETELGQLPEGLRSFFQWPGEKKQLLRVIAAQEKSEKVEISIEGDQVRIRFQYADDHPESLIVHADGSFRWCREFRLI